MVLCVLCYCSVHTTGHQGILVFSLQSTTITFPQVGIEQQSFVHFKAALHCHQTGFSRQTFTIGGILLIIIFNNIMGLWIHFHGPHGFADPFHADQL
jgi:hypothetical protein